MIKLDEIIEAIESTNDEIRWYYNTVEKKLYMASSYDFDGEYVFDIDEMEAKDEMISLPTAYDINEYQIMVDFSRFHVPELLDMLHGKKVFRRFKDRIFSMGIEQEWYAFKDEKIKVIAQEWCEKHGLEA